MRVLPQPHVPPSTRPSVSAPTPAVISSALNPSGHGIGWPGTSGSRRHAAIRAAIPIGTFTRNTHRQLAATSIPPTAGPSAAANPPTAVQVRTALWRRSAGNVARISPSDVGVSSAAPAAWTTRKAISIGRLVAAAHAADAATNTATPTMNPRSRG